MATFVWASVSNFRIWQYRWYLKKYILAISSLWSSLVTLGLRRLSLFRNYYEALAKAVSKTGERQKAHIKTSVHEYKQNTRGGGISLDEKKSPPRRFWQKRSLLASFALYDAIIRPNALVWQYGRKYYRMNIIANWNACKTFSHPYQAVS